MNNNMDTPIERKSRLKKKHLYAMAGGTFLLVCLLYFIFRDTSSSMKVDKERLTISTIVQGEFNDYIRVIGQVLPDRIIYLDAIEGGRVEERLIEEGAQVKAGDVILRLSNPLLNIGILQSEADLAYQENELRNTRISMEQEHRCRNRTVSASTKNWYRRTAVTGNTNACITNNSWRVKISCWQRRTTKAPATSLSCWTSVSARTTFSAAASWRAWMRISGT